MATEHAALVAAERDNQRLRGKLDRVLKDGKNALKQGVNSALTVGTAYGVAYFENRFPERAKVADMQISLVVGGLALTAGAMGWTGEDEIVMAIGNGALAANAASRGAAMGADAKAKAKP